jgi:hypothetical protein
MSKTPVFSTTGRAIVVISMLILAQSCSKWTDREVERTKRAGEEVRSALDRFRAETGLYPTNLDLLIPKFLPKIPQPTVGEKRWDYKTFEEGSAYVISVEIRSFDEPLLQATSRQGWGIDRH